MRTGIFLEKVLSSCWRCPTLANMRMEALRTFGLMKSKIAFISQKEVKHQSHTSIYLAR